MTENQALAAIAKSEGYESWNKFFQDRQLTLLDVVVPSICMECGYITEMEGDQEEGCCDECEENTVKSCLILAGLI